MNEHNELIENPRNYVDFLNRRILYYRICMLNMSINDFLSQPLRFRKWALASLNWDSHIMLKPNHYYIIRSKGIIASDVKMICNKSITHYKLHRIAYTKAIKTISNFNKLPLHKRKFKLINIEKHVAGELGYGSFLGEVSVIKADYAVPLCLIRMGTNPFYCIKDLGTNASKIRHAVHTNKIAFWSVYAYDSDSRYWSFQRVAKSYKYVGGFILIHNTIDPYYRVLTSIRLIKNLFYQYNRFYHVKRTKLKNKYMSNIKHIKGFLNSKYGIDDNALHEIKDSSREQSALYNV